MFSANGDIERTSHYTTIDAAIQGYRRFYQDELWIEVYCVDTHTNILVATIVESVVATA